MKGMRSSNRSRIFTGLELDLPSKKLDISLYIWLSIETGIH